MRLCTQVDTLVNQLRGVLRYIPAKGLVAGLPLICIKAEHQGISLRAGPASMIATTIINTINYPHVYMLHL
jgi:hypothetical protein